MANSIEDYCSFSMLGIASYENRSNFFEEISRVANFFGFNGLPDELKLKINICSRLEFKRKKKLLYEKKMDSLIAFTYNINKIYILEYECLKCSYSLKAYEAALVHECIHAFQAYFSKIMPDKYIWLYESVACYLAKQKKEINKKNIVSWESFVKNFYKCSDCYGLAYNYGKAIFNQYNDEILSVIKVPDDYMNELMNLYFKIYYETLTTE